MKSLTFRVGLTVAAAALAAAPALAQKPGDGGSPAADRPVAVARAGTSGGGGGASGARSAPAGVATSAGSSGSVGMSSPSSVSVSMPSSGFGGSRAAFREAAPQRRTSGGQSTGQAVPRGSSGSSGSSSSGASAPRSAAPAAPSSSGHVRSTTPVRQGSNRESSGSTQAVPNWARPRGDRPASGTAVTRTTPRPDRLGGLGYGYGRYYDPYGYYYSPYYYGNYYSPYGFYSPYTLGYGFGLGFPWMTDPWYGPDDYWYGGGGYSSSQSLRDEDQGNLRLKVKPRDAKVYVDGYFVGTVDSMDGVFQKLALNGGRHRVEVKADGYQPEQFEIVITPGETATYEGELKKIG